MAFQGILIPRQQVQLQLPKQEQDVLIVRLSAENSKITVAIIVILTILLYILKEINSSKNRLS